MSDTTVRNLDALLLGTGEFSFSPDATSVTDARAKGYRDFGNVVATGLKPETDKVEHEGSYRGKRRVDKTYVTKTALEYSLKLDEFSRENMKLALGGIDSSPGSITQAAKTKAAGDTLAFETTAGVTDRWYDLLISGTQVREVTDVMLFNVTTTATVTSTASTKLINLTSHGLAAGTPVLFIGSPVPSALAANTVYYVINPTTDAFQIAETPGGMAATLGSDETGMTLSTQTISPSAFTLDGKIGRVRFAAAQTADLLPIITASAITSGDAANLLGQTPLDTMIREGYGRLAIFDDTHPNKLVYLHEGFSCQVYLDSLDDTDGKKVAEMTLKVRVTDNVGTVWTAE